MATQADREAISQNSPDVWIVLLELAHASMPTPIRITSDNVDTVHLGDTYQVFPFYLALPNDDDQVPTTQLTISNVSREIGRAVEGIATSPNVTITLVLASDPDTVVLQFTGFEFTDISWDAMSMTGTLSQRVYWDEPYPKQRSTPSLFPGLFQ